MKVKQEYFCETMIKFAGIHLLIKIPDNERNIFAKHALIVVLLVILIIKVTSPIKQTIGWDFYGYYLYLPALFKYDDIGLEDKSWVKENNEKYNNRNYASNNFIRRIIINFVLFKTPKTNVFPKAFDNYSGF